jgi:hypothetical protein
MASIYRIKETLADDPEGGDWDSWIVNRLEGENELVTVCHCFDKTEAYRVLNALQWMESLEAGNMPTTERLKVVPPVKTKRRVKP